MLQSLHALLRVRTRNDQIILFSVPCKQWIYNFPSAKMKIVLEIVVCKLVCQTHSVERVVAATAELVATLRAAEVHAASFGQSVLEATVWTRCSGRREDKPANQIQPSTVSQVLLAGNYYRNMI